jgi:glucose-6-phosphate isomerase
MPDDFHLANLERPIHDRLLAAERQGLSRRLWAREAALWKEPPEIQEKIRNRLGWLDVAAKMQGRVPELSAFASRAKAEGFSRTVLLGMGGSSLAPEVIQGTVGSQNGFPRLTILDTTEPSAIRAAAAALDLPHTLFLVSSKSGGTLETVSLYRYFRQLLDAVDAEHAGQHFVAITDPGSSLEALARKERFRDLFLNPPDIGGRYSALSLFGLVPAALIGTDHLGKGRGSGLEMFLASAQEMMQRCGPDQVGEQNPGLKLGIALGEAALAGRDKLTIVATYPFESFGAWAEQLIAESTGKKGKGIVPIDGEPLGAPGVYGADRFFVALFGEGNADLQGRLAALREKGHPVVILQPLGPRGPYDLAGEFFRWEFATAVAGAILEINPFDEPNVTESKENTAALLTSSGQPPAESPLLTQGALTVFGDAALPKTDLAVLLRAFFADRRPEQYLALQAYLPPNQEVTDALQGIRGGLRDSLKMATTVGFGPRFLHSTGQLHKGGPSVGTFIQITCDVGEELPIPGAPYGFGRLITAQAAGDLNALRKRTKRLLRLHLSGDLTPALDELKQAFAKLG